MIEESPSPAEEPRLGRTTALMTAGTVLSRVTGVARLGLLAWTLGVAETRFTDTYNLANSVPNVVYELVLGGVITAVFVPVFVEILDGRDDGEETVSGIVNVCLLALTLLALAGIFAAPAIASFYSASLSGAEAEAQQRAITTLLRFFLPQIPLYGLYFLGSAFLNVRKKFVLPMWTPIVNNLVLIVVLIAFAVMYGKVDVESVTSSQLALLGLGTTLSVAPMGVLIVPALRRAGYRATWKFDRDVWRRVARLSGYAVGFVAANQIGFLAIQRIANESQGAFTAYTAAFTFFLLPVGLFVWSITTALAPSLSRTALKPGREGMGDVVSLALRSTLFLVVPCAAGFLVLSRPIVEVLLERGIVTPRSTDLVVGILSFLVLGLVQFSLFQVLMRASYALQDARSPFVVNSIVIAVNIALNVAMFRWIGPEGLAAGHAIAYTLAIALQGRIVAREVPGIDLRRILRTVLKVSAAATGMAALVFALGRLIDDATGALLVAGVAVAVAVGAASYLWFASLLRVEEMEFVRELVGKRFSRRPQAHSSSS